jgi:hypothetical protein
MAAISWVSVVPEYEGEEIPSVFHIDYNKASAEDFEWPRTIDSFASWNASGLVDEGFPWSFPMPYDPGSIWLIAACNIPTQIHFTFTAAESNSSKSDIRDNDLDAGDRIPQLIDQTVQCKGNSQAVRAYLGTLDHSINVDTTAVLDVSGSEVILWFGNSNHDSRL